jgi:RNA polymerase sigma-70 factor (ECF subfamily)
VTFNAQSSDLELVDACRDVQDDRFEAAFEELYRRYRDRVYSIAYRMTGSANDALDVAQDTFRVLFLKIGTFRADALFSTWLFRIVVNCASDHRRRLHGRRRAVPRAMTDLGHEPEPTDPSDSPVEVAASSEAGEHVHAALLRLSPKLRAVLVLRYLEGLSYEDLAVALAVQPGTIKSRLARAHVALERELSASAEALGFGIPGTRSRFASAASAGETTDDPPADPGSSGSGRRQGVA